MSFRIVFFFFCLLSISGNIRAQQVDFCLAEDPAPPIANPLGLTVYDAKTWPNGSRISVSFMDKPTTQLRSRIIRFAKEWEQYANITFVFGANDNTNANIRIGLKTGAGHNSKIGTLSKGNFRTSMNFDGYTDATSDARVRRTVIHEFGHALGLKHEHQAPRNGICWDHEAVYDDLGGPPSNWSRTRVSNNIFKKLDGGTYSNAGGYDSQSIMHYSIPQSWTSCDFTVGSNFVLSAMDKSYIGRIYPKPFDFPGSMIMESTWTKGWDNSLIYEQNGTNFLVLVKREGKSSRNANVHVNKIAADGTIGSIVYTSNVASGVTDIRYYEVGNRGYVAMLRAKRSSGKTVSIYQAQANGNVGTLLKEYTWTDGWSDMAFYQAGGKTYFMHYKAQGTSNAGNNIVIRPISADGTLGQATHDTKWTSGWTDHRAYAIGGKNYLLSIKNKGFSSSGHNFLVHEMTASGKVGRRLQANKWSENFDNVNIFEVGGRPYVVFVKSSNGEVSVLDIMDDGRLGAKKYGVNKRWSTGWDNVLIYQTASGSSYLFLLKSGTGKMKVQLLGSSGTLAR